MKNIRIIGSLILGIFIIVSCKRNNNDGDTSNSEWDSTSVLLTEMEIADEPEYVDPGLRLKYQPRLQEYKYSYDRELRTRSSEMTNGDWKHKGFSNPSNIFLNKIGGALFNGIDVSDVYGGYSTSKIYDEHFRNKTVDPSINNNAIRLAIFRHPDTAIPMMEINGQLVNTDRMNIYAHENGSLVEMSFRCNAEHPILDLEGEDKDYPISIPYGLYHYETKEPFYWYASSLRRDKKIEEEIGGGIQTELPKGYSEQELRHAKNKIEELKSEGGYSYYQAIRKKEAIDPENNDYQKYFFVNVKVYDCNTNPTVSLTFDDAEFALIMENNRAEAKEIPIEELAEIENYAFGPYIHRVVANNQNIDPMNLNESIVASNLGLYGKSEVARENVNVGWDTYVDGKLFGRIFETIKLSDGYRFYFFKNVEPNHVEVIEVLNKNNYSGKISITNNGHVKHLEREEEY